MPVRSWLTVILDDHCRAITGQFISLDAPSALNTALALRQAIKRTPNPEWIMSGIPGQLYVDNGSEFISENIEQTCIILRPADGRAWIVRLGPSDILGLACSQLLQLQLQLLNRAGDPLPGPAELHSVSLGDLKAKPLDLRRVELHRGLCGLRLALTCQGEGTQGGRSVASINGTARERQFRNRRQAYHVSPFMARSTRDNAFSLTYASTLIRESFGRTISSRRPPTCESRHRYLRTVHSFVRG